MTRDALSSLTRAYREIKAPPTLAARVVAAGAQRRAPLQQPAWLALAAGVVIVAIVLILPRGLQTEPLRVAANPVSTSLPSMSLSKPVSPRVPALGAPVRAPRSSQLRTPKRPRVNSPVKEKVHATR